ncbi:hypothetical protein ACIQNG_03565 [Streptomyces sp. NPDC091377]|uniref:hypothetical protein n=1 Tax=Streptomyces sp. NPDC091377 TaxID=3365995 RepID=UPI003802D5CF
MSGVSGVSGMGGASARQMVDRPGRPVSPGAWDTRSEEWLGEGTSEVGRDDGDFGGDGRGAEPAIGGAGPTGEPSGPGRSGERRVITAAGQAVGSRKTAGQATGSTRMAGQATGSRKTAGQAVGPRRGTADPVKALMHQHRDLCEQAVDALEIAAGLEAHGVTDRTATRFLHRDVFSLAEEMFARVPRDGEARPRPEALTVPEVRAGWIVRTLLPGALGAATVAALPYTDGLLRPAVAAIGILATALGLRAALTAGPLAPRRPLPGTYPSNGVWICWLLAYAVLGDGLLQAALTGGPDTLPTGTPDGPWPLTAAPLLTLALACAPAAWAAHLFAAGARRALTASRGLEEFAGAVRPRLLGSFALFLGALAALSTGCATLLDEPGTPFRLSQTLTLGALLLLARLLHLHGFTHAPAVILTAAAGTEALALTTVFAGRLPGLDPVALPVESLVDTWGPAAVPTLICGLGALALLVHAARTLTRASAHARTESP